MIIVKTKSSDIYLGYTYYNMNNYGGRQGYIFWPLIFIEIKKTGKNWEKKKRRKKEEKREEKRKKRRK